MTLHDCMTLASYCMMCAPLVTRVSTSHFHIDCRLCYLWIQLHCVAVWRVTRTVQCALTLYDMVWEMGQQHRKGGDIFCSIHFYLSSLSHHLPA